MTEIEQHVLDQMEKMPYFIHNDMAVDKISVDGSVLHVKMKKEFTNPYGMPHGGLIFTLADSCAGATARADGRRYVTLDANIHYLSTAKAKDAVLTATGSVIKRGRSTCIVEVLITDETGIRIAKADVTMFCLG